MSLNPETNPALQFLNLEPLVVLAAPLFAMPEDDEDEDADEDDDGDEDEDEEHEDEDEDDED